MVAPLSSPSPSSTSATSSTGRHLPASTSESALAARARLGNKVPPPPPPPAQPKRVRPFILRARNSAAPAASASSKARAANSEEADLTSQLRKSKTSCDLEASAGSSPTRPRQTKTARDHENVPPPLPPLAHHHRSSPTRTKKRIARPISLATNSLRAIGSFSSSAASASGSNTGSSAAAAGTAKPAGGMMATTRRRPLSYVVSSSSPPRTRHPPATASHRAPSTSPSRTRTPRARMSAPSPDESPSSSRRAATTTTATGGTSRASNSSAASRMSALPSFSSSSAAASPRTLASPPHAVKTQSRHAAVELHKSALKRKTLEERQQARGDGGATSPSAVEPFADSGANTPLESLSASAATESAAMARGGLTRSRRWFGKLEPEQDEDTCAHTHLDDTPTAATQRELDAYATPPPPPAARVSSAARKKASYAALPVHQHPDRSDRAQEEQPTTHHTGYTSLQELLEQHGYADTRVITPHSTTQTARIRSAMADDVRADLFSYPDDANEDGGDDDEEVEVLASPLANRTRNRSSSPGPKRLPKTAEDIPTEPKELKERPSLLSLRGLFSFFGSSAVDVEEDLATSPQLGFHQRTEEEPSPPLTTTLESEATPVPQRLRTVSEMHRWVETVNEVYPPPSMPASTASSATAVMPELHFEHTADDDDDAASCRSYSSSISFSGSPPTPQPLFGGVDYGVVAPSSFSGSHLSPPVPVHDADLPRNKRLSLRHTVSDSNLLPSYQSFAGLGISAPSPPPTLHSQLAATRPAQMDLVAAGRETTAMITSSSSAAATASGLWGTTLLRTRASQLFSLAMARSPVDAATGRSFFTMPPPPLARTEATTFRSAHSRAPPKLLRKAVSSAGLVSAPQVRRTRVVTKASWESFGSLEAKVSLEGGRPGSAASGGEADMEGGIGWGEDLLGRAWA